MCQYPTCFGIASNNTAQVCSGRGTCVSPDVCSSCTPVTSWGGPRCEIPMCYGFLANDTTNVCAGKGSCVAPDVCSTCQSGWAGTRCNIPICFGFMANNTAQVCAGRGVCVAPDVCASSIGADVSHMNLHKTFCIPHGGGGPGMGPIGARAHLAPFMADHAVRPTGGANRANAGQSAVSAAPFGSASILPISWMYINLMGGTGLTRATEVAILNANYLAARLAPHYPVLYTGSQGRVAHECIIDIRPIKAATGIAEIDIAKRLMDYGFHAPTVSFPVAGTIMIEPTESESKAELDRFADALIAIREEINHVETGLWMLEESTLKNAPHTQADLAQAEWHRPYTRMEAAFPLPWVLENKFWPFVNRIDDVYGDRNLFCACMPIDDTPE